MATLVKDYSGIVYVDIFYQIFITPKFSWVNMSEICKILLIVI